MAVRRSKRRPVASSSPHQSSSAYVLANQWSSSTSLTRSQPEGAKRIENVVSKANDYEKKLLQACYSGLKGNISKGIEFIQNPPSK